MKNVVKFIALVVIMTLPGMLLAEGSIGDVADNLLGPTSIVTKLVEIACYIIGVAFILVSISQYKIHRQSPKLVPLTTPILLFVLGFVALFIPYTTQMGKTGRVELKQEEPTTLPLPDQINQGPKIPQSPLTPGSDRSVPAAPDNSQTPPPADGSGSGGSHWTDDPRYR